MGFWDTLGNVITSFGEMNKEAISDAAKLSTDELCQKVNSINVLMNPLIYTACVDELKQRIQKMPKSELMAYFDEYGAHERIDVKDILVEELKKRGLLDSEEQYHCIFNTTLQEVLDVWIWKK